MYEQRTTPPLSRPAFRRRMWRHGLAALAVLVVSLAIGVAGFMAFDGAPAERALLNAAVMLAGLGMAEMPATGAARVFASLYALYAGLTFLGAAGIVVAPVMHRLLHRFHWDGDTSETSPK